MLSLPLPNLVALALSGTMSPSQDPPTYKNEIHVQRSFGTPGDPRPGLFSYSNDKSGGVSYSIEAALSYSREPIGDRAETRKDLFADYILSYGVSAVLNQDSDAEDALSLELSVDRIDKRLDLPNQNRPHAEKFYRYYALAYQTDRKMEAQKYLVSAKWSYINLPKGFGAFSEGGRGLKVAFEPVLGFDLGQVQTRGTSAEDEGLLLRLFGSGRLNFKLTDIPNVIFYYEHAGHYLTRQDGRKGFNQWRVGSEIALNATASLVLEYKRGETAPEFKHANVWRMALGVKF